MNGIFRTVSCLEFEQFQVVSSHDTTTLIYIRSKDQGISDDEEKLLLYLYFIFCFSHASLMIEESLYITRITIIANMNII